MAKFPDILKKAEVTSVYKNDDMNVKQSYRLLSAISNLSVVWKTYLLSN